MKRRTFAAAASGTLAGLAGCLDQVGGGDGDGGEPATTTASDGTGDDGTSVDGSESLPPEIDGYPETVESKPEDRQIDTSTLDTVTENGVEVPLLPVDDAHVWWAYKRARFADARGPDQWENSHVVGAVSSPAAPDMRPADDPPAKWGKQDNIVCYCGCPHHLSSIRASQLIQDGYENVYVIDEGFFEWRDRGYPLSNDGGDLAQFTVRGQLDARYAGENAWVSPVESDQLESSDVAADGSFELHCKFVDVTQNSRIRVETPAWTRTGSIAELTAGVLQGDPHERRSSRHLSVGTEW